MRSVATPDPPRYQQVFNQLAADLANGRYQPGQKLPSEAALVRQFDTSRITVGRALRELTRAGLVTRRAGSGTFAAGSAQQATAAAVGKLFGLLIPNLGESEIFAPICQGMAAAPSTVSHALLWGQTADRASSLDIQALELCDQFIARRVDGVFFAPVERTPGRDATNREVLQRLSKAKIPIVLLDRDALPFPERSAYDLVGIDNRRAAYLATQHLLQRGSRRVIFVTFPEAAPTSSARLAGYFEAMRSFGTPVTEKAIVRLSAVTPEGVVKILHSTGADGAVCLNDHLAGEWMRALLSLHVRVPEQLRIVGIDDVEYSSLLPVPLSTIHQPCREIGEAAMETMLERLAQPQRPVRDVLLPSWLVERESSR